MAIVVGPVFPHEVVGFSGGNKYFFPGVSGQELIDLSHWVGALITSAKMIGTPGVTPVRALINEAATLIPADRLALCLVVASGTDTLHAAAFGTPEDAWAACAEISAETHVTYRDTPVRRVLSIMPTKYEDIWTAAKGFYKLEPIVADGGEVIIYAPHITQVSVMHPQITEIGYHCRDYFLGQWDRFKNQPWGDLAHSTHLRGQGTWDPENGERNRVTVTLATGIPEEVVRSVNLNYLDPATVNIAAYEADPDTLVEPHAGEVLYRLRSPGSGTGRGEPDGTGTLTLRPGRLRLQLAGHPNAVDSSPRARLRGCSIVPTRLAGSFPRYSPLVTRSSHGPECGRPPQDTLPLGGSARSDTRTRRARHFARASACWPRRHRPTRSASREQDPPDST